ncbi:conserved hypothetical protein [Talaromyces stipitatus ATCC 10500]|uniref:Uncharacterized protein n=1 Tax=Talaromyces stipitatus (strain ATCC 10500 / CBS 375.48 / QM 6759 / NRRL 1006) TaxID=441959 RepID=B8MLH7_TALSN|nr:uncharacterized protein TSTA_049470 [Talaromyces stipitatus ATCC 10500]EED15510.1 conserved hypothetical protein [Talaromyces stipitatus ATCC 10500]
MKTKLLDPRNSASSLQNRAQDTAPRITQADMTATADRIQKDTDLTGTGTTIVITARAIPQNAKRPRNHLLRPAATFRESLFDALGDDEGALYWESVYGQPIHTYAIPSVPKGPNGELERMTDEEYAEYVQAKMWERSHEGIMQERERQRQENAKAKQRAEAEQQRAFRDRTQFNEALEESLKRGEKRRRAKLWIAAWEKYMKSWEGLDASSKAPPATSSDTEKPFYIRNYIHWPVESGKRRDISRDAVREFMQHSSESFLNTLKAERIRWHPDKMLHRYGSLGLGEEKTLVQSITEVFQILDDLWIEEKGRQSR